MPTCCAWPQTARFRQARRHEDYFNPKEIIMSTVPLAVLGAQGWVARELPRFPAAFYLSSGVAVTAPLDLNENIIGSLVLPADSLGPNGYLEVTGIISCTDSIGTKTFWFRIDGVNFMATIFGVGNASAFYSQRIFNRNSKTANMYQNGNTVPGPSSAAMITTAIDTTVAKTIVFATQKNTAGDSIICQHFSINAVWVA